MDNLALDTCGLAAVALLTLSVLLQLGVAPETNRFMNAQCCLAWLMGIYFVIGCLNEIT